MKELNNIMVEINRDLATRSKYYEFLKKHEREIPYVIELGIKNPFAQRFYPFYIDYLTKWELERKKNLRILDDETKNKLLNIKNEIRELYKKQKRIIERNKHKFKPITEEWLKEHQIIKDQLLKKFRIK